MSLFTDDLPEESEAPAMKCANCDKNPAQALHGCPFQAEINDNNDPKYCACCDECRAQCADDI